MNHIAAIHTIKAQLAKQGVMTDEDYRALLLQLTGKSSSKDLSPLALAKVREHFDKLAVQHGVAKPKTSARFAAAEGRPRIVDVANISMIKKVRAQLIALGKKPDSYADGVLQQMYGAQAPQFYELAPWDKMASLISALTRQQERAGGMKY